MGKAKPVVSKAKAKAGGKAEEAPAAEEEAAQPTAEQLEAKRLWQLRRDATNWAKTKLEVVRGQLMAAQKKGLSFDWLQVAHEFHEKRLIRLVKRLDEKALDGADQELRDGVEAYLSQCAAGPDVEKESFKEYRDVWEALEQEGGAYQRPAESAEALAAVGKLKEFVVAQERDVDALTALMSLHIASAGVQEAGMTRIGGLFAQSRDAGELPGLTCSALMPAIEASMRRHLPDPGVQRAGFAALRGLAMAPGQLPLMRDARAIELAVEALLAQFKDKEAAQAANGCFWAMAQAAGKNSPELATMRAAGVVEALMKVMSHHAWDQTLTGRVRVTLPFITDD